MSQSADVVLTERPFAAGAEATWPVNRDLLNRRIPRGCAVAAKFVALIALGLCTDVPAFADAAIQGRVLSTGKGPVADAIVTARIPPLAAPDSAATTFSDADGFYRLSTERRGLAAIVVTAVGYAPSATLLPFVDDMVAPVFELAPSESCLVLVVRDDGRPVAEAAVTVRVGGSLWSGPYPTRPDGSAVVPCSDSSRLLAAVGKGVGLAVGECYGSCALTLIPQEKMGRHLVPAEWSTARTRLLWGGQEVASLDDGRFVWLPKVADSSLLSLQRDSAATRLTLGSEGGLHAAFQPPAPDDSNTKHRSTLLWTHEPWWSWQARLVSGRATAPERSGFTVYRSEADLVTSEFGRPSGAIVDRVRISGDVSSSSGVPIAGARVSLELSAEGPHGREERYLAAVHTDPVGVFSFPSVDARRAMASLWVSAPGHRSEGVQVPRLGQAARQGLNKVSVVLRESVALRFAVVDGAGRGLMGAEAGVFASGPHDRFRLAPVSQWGGALSDIGIADDQGVVVVDGAPVGSHDLVVSAHGFRTEVLRSLRVENGPGGIQEIPALQLSSGVALQGIARWGSRPVAEARILLREHTGLETPWTLPWVRPMAVHSDHDGKFELPGLEDGQKYDLLAASERYGTVTLKAVEAPAHNLELEFAGLVLAGLVADPTGIPVANAVVRAELAAGGSRQESTGSNGHFEMRGLPSGTLELSVAAIDFDVWKGRFDLRQSDSGLDVRLTPASASLDGVVTLAGRPLPGVVVGLGWGDRHNQTTGVDGRYAFARAPAGEVTVIARHSDAWRLVRNVVLEAGPNFLELAFSRVRLSGTILQTGTLEPVAEAWLRVVSRGRSNPYAGTFQSDMEGAFQLVLPAGTFDVYLGAAGYGERRIDLNASSDASGILWYLDPASRLKGQVVSRDGGLVAGARVTVTTSSGAERSVVSEADGTFLFDDLPAGRTALTAGLGNLRSESSIVDLQVGREARASIYLEPTRRLEGTLSWQGIPHVGIEVVLTAGSLAGALRTYTDHAGRFSFSVLPSEPKLLVVGGTEIPDAMGGSPGPLEIELPLNEVRLDVLSGGLGAATLVELHPASFWRHSVRTSAWPMRVWRVGRQAVFSGVPAGRYMAAFYRDTEVLDVRELEIPSSLEGLVHVAIE